MGIIQFTGQPEIRRPIPIPPFKRQGQRESIFPSLFIDNLPHRTDRKFKADRQLFIISAVEHDPDPCVALITVDIIIIREGYPAAFQIQEEFSHNGAAGGMAEPLTETDIEGKQGLGVIRVAGHLLRDRQAAAAEHVDNGPDDLRSVLRAVVFVVAVKEPG